MTARLNGILGSAAACDAITNWAQLNDGHDLMHTFETSRNKRAKTGEYAR